jgi:hypothetical protein
MTPDQYERWEDFARRMARTCFLANRRPTSWWIEEVVQEFFDGFAADDIPCVVNWDRSVEYPEGNPRREREYQQTYCCCHGKRRKGQDERGKVSVIPDPDCPECHGSGVHRAWMQPWCVSDMVSEHLDGYRGYVPGCRACRTYADEMECRCDEIEHLYYEQWDDQWGGPVHSCIRAGLDFASEPSLGVLGFTAGDLRRMYPEGVPDWVFAPNERLEYWPSGDLNGVFAELPDTASMVF